MPIIYRTPWFYAAGLVVLIIALVYFGWLDLRRSGRLRTSAVVMWLLALLAIGIKLPSYAFDEIRVDQDHMQWHVGPWWAPIEGTILFSEVRSICVEKATGGSGRNRRIETNWVLESPNGTTERYLIFELWMENYQSIQGHFTSKGIVLDARCESAD